MNIQFMLKLIFSLIWYKRLRGYKLIKVTGWRSCLMEAKSGQRIRGTFVFTENKDLNKCPRTFVRENTDTFTLRQKDPDDTSNYGY